MVRGLTRHILPFVIGALGVSFSAGSVAQSATLDGDEQQRFLTELRQLYLAKDDRSALLAHANSLLQTHAYRAGYQVGNANAEDLLYQLEAGKGVINTREERRTPAAVAVRNRQVEVYGVDPFVSYRCEVRQPTCTVYLPHSENTWLTIVRDHDGAAELAKTLSFLIRNVQQR
ncbi:hypothetical protein [Atopomonas sediminilitoris]|uniref:hypothetical protein n=1 Tax=Atopomonas sediminilitoris TaxID=2919919 RepID=UPI001F4DF40A|nr:hypothetical protein [Atopomonas sediminilitoris]MCJ8170332.1 hypothetical protein [Atopomonas sediminilitoris]